MFSFPPTLLSVPGVALLRDFVSHCHDCSFFVSRDNEMEAGIASSHSLTSFHFSPSICTTAMAARASRRRVVSSSWSAVKRCSAEAPRWGFSWGWDAFLSCPPLWAGCDPVRSCLAPKRNWVSRRRRRQLQDFLNAWLCWFTHHPEAVLPGRLCEQ